jgi:hypothetical protein
MYYESSVCVCAFKWRTLPYDSAFCDSLSQQMHIQTPSTSPAFEEVFIFYRSLSLKRITTFCTNCKYESFRFHCSVYLNYGTIVTCS